MGTDCHNGGSIVFAHRADLGLSATVTLGGAPTAGQGPASSHFGRWRGDSKSWNLSPPTISRRSFSLSRTENVVHLRLLSPFPLGQSAGHLRSIASGRAPSLDRPDLARAYLSYRELCLSRDLLTP
jgi:hypothetical protein